MVNAKHDDIVDYAMPLIQVEKLVKRIHELCLRKEYIAANDICPDIITEVRMLSASLVIMDTLQQRKGAEA